MSSQSSIEDACVPHTGGGLAALPDRHNWRIQRRRAVWRTAAVRGNRITTLVLDLGGVLAPTLFETVQLQGFPRGPLAGKPDPYDDVERGVASERDYWEQLQRANGWDIRQLWQRCTRLRPSMMIALSAILARLPVVGFTNDMSHWFGDRWKTRFPELDRLDRVVEAARLGVYKPHPEAFAALLGLLGEPAHRCLFVDDLAVNLDGAEALGMQTLLFDVRRPEASTRGVLARLAIPWPQTTGGTP